MCVGRKGSSGGGFVCEAYLFGCVRAGLCVAEDGELQVHWGVSVQVKTWRV